MMGRLALCIAAFATGILVPLTVSPGGSGELVVDRDPVRVTVVSRVHTAHVAQHAGCSLPVSEIGILASAADVSAPTNLSGIAASATGCTIVTWNTSGDVFVSRDDGATYARLPVFPVVDPWAARDLSAAVGRDETVYVVRAAGLEVVTRDGNIVLRDVPTADLGHIVVSGRWILMRSATQLAASEDEGRSWRVVRAPANIMTAAIDDDGTVRLAVALTPNTLRYDVGNLHDGGWRTIWTCPAHRLYADPSNPTRLDSYHDVDGFAFGSDGVLYAERYDAYGYQVLAITRSGDMRTIDRLADAAPLRGATVLWGGHPVAVRDADGDMLLLRQGQGPFRQSANNDHVMPMAYATESERWLVGGVQPE
jgi:hypothetical protein